MISDYCTFASFLDDAFTAILIPFCAHCAKVADADERGSLTAVALYALAVGTVPSAGHRGDGPNKDSKDDTTFHWDLLLWLNCLKYIICLYFCLLSSALS